MKLFEKYKASLIYGLKASGGMMGFITVKEVKKLLTE